MSLTPRLRHRVTLESPGGAQDAATGEMTTGWAVFAANVPAEVVPLSGREFLQSESAQSEVTARMTIRYMPGVVPTMRVVFDGVVYAIQAVLPDPTGRRHLTLMVSRGVGNGE